MQRINLKYYKCTCLQIGEKYLFSISNTSWNIFTHFRSGEKVKISGEKIRKITNAHAPNVFCSKILRHNVGWNHLFTYSSGEKINLLIPFEEGGESRQQCFIDMGI